MIGCYDFCGHYEWTFEWLRQQGGEELVHRFWEKAIGQDSQRHAAAQIAEKGFAGMKEYWAHTLTEEAAGYTFTEKLGVVRIDMHECPSKGFLLRNGLEQYSDYCDHCIGWIGPMMKKAGFQVHHKHNHCGKCWWEFRRSTDSSPASDTGILAGQNDVRLHEDWAVHGQSIDVFRNSVDASKKTGSPPSAESLQRFDPMTLRHGVSAVSRQWLCYPPPAVCHRDQTTDLTNHEKHLMIIDHIHHAKQFHALGIGVRAGLHFLTRPDLMALEKGRYDLPDSGGSYALLQEHETKLRSQAKWEAHRKMIDLQFMVRGRELMGYSDIARLKMEEYHDADDYCLGEGAGEWLRLDAQYFMILFPQDGHMPSIAVSEPQKVRKVVVKIPVETLPISFES